jgi:hypothetical protein
VSATIELQYWFHTEEKNRLDTAECSATIELQYWFHRLPEGLYPHRTFEDQM